MEASYSEELIDNSVALAQKSFVKRYKIPKKKTTEEDDGEEEVLGRPPKMFSKSPWVLEISDRV